MAICQSNFPDITLSWQKYNRLSHDTKIHNHIEQAIKHMTLCSIVQHCAALCSIVQHCAAYPSKHGAYLFFRIIIPKTKLATKDPYKIRGKLTIKNQVNQILCLDGWRIMNN